MEMESVHLNDDNNSIEESSVERLTVPASPVISGILGDPQVYPRVGDKYQVEMPPMIPKTEAFQVLLNTYDSEDTNDGSQLYVMGLPIPVSWVHNRKNPKEDERYKRNNPDCSANASTSNKSRNSRKNDSLKKGSRQNSEQQDLWIDNGQEFMLTKFQKMVAVKANLPCLHKKKNYDLVPGIFGQPWTDAEVNGFILGLYILGKNFVQIKRFLGKKEMGDLLSFYYGEFYRSDGYRRWSGCKKTKRKKCIYGHKIFTGWRQQELLARLQPHVPEHSQNAFLEVSAAFSEGKCSLEDYVSNLKAIVGIQALVDGIGIGKGKMDLTSLTTEPSKNNPLFTVCPIGKACSALTCSNIVKLLTGGYRLSKAQCNDIFWEAVWPRLLARGWHSEQPKNQSYMDPNHSLVFLIPGVKKFSKRKLVKGNHYFDSVNDVLNKVASEPKLIEHENEADRCAAEAQLGQDDPSIRQPLRYLEPRVSNLKLARFTIVDSGLVNGGKLSNLRQMRYSPSDLKVKSLFTTLLSSIEIILLDNLANNDDRVSADTLSDGGRKVNNVDYSKSAADDCGTNNTKFTIVDTSLICSGNSSKVREMRYSPVESKNSSREKDKYSPEDSLSKLLNGEKFLKEQKFLKQETRNKLQENIPENQSTRTIKHKFSRRPESGNSNSLVPVVKRRRLTACSTDVCRTIKNFSVASESKQEGPCCALSSPEMPEATCLGTETPSLIDLNLPQVPSESENDEPASMDVERMQAASIEKPLFLSNSGKPDSEALNVNSRRQSTRNRPLTTRALEALECGFMGMKRH